MTISVCPEMTSVSFPNSPEIWGHETGVELNNNKVIFCNTSPSTIRELKDISICQRKEQGFRHKAIEKNFALDIFYCSSGHPIISRGGPYGEKFDCRKARELVSKPLFLRGLFFF